MVLMIIKGLSRRYERWNPVHPTNGAFWGMGIGIGCGVGWGPGFGPEVIGYVGAGCGVGFSVGFTLAGVGIGLPSNGLLKVPYNAMMATRTCASHVLRSSAGIFPAKNALGDGWNSIANCISGLQKETTGRLSRLIPIHYLDERVGVFDFKTALSVHTRAIQEGFGRFRSHFSSPNKGLKD